MSTARAAACGRPSSWRSSAGQPLSGGWVPHGKHMQDVGQGWLILLADSFFFGPISPYNAIARPGCSTLALRAEAWTRPGTPIAVAARRSPRIAGSSHGVMGSRVPLSEHEQQALEAMEQALYEQDPAFAHRVRSENHSLLGIVWTAITAMVMFSLAAGKARTGRQLGNPVLQQKAGSPWWMLSLASAVLLGLTLNAQLGWWWADPLAGYVILVYGIKEARAALRPVHTPHLSDSPHPRREEWRGDRLR